MKRSFKFLIHLAFVFSLFPGHSPALAHSPAASGNPYLSENPAFQNPSLPKLLKWPRGLMIFPESNNADRINEVFLLNEFTTPHWQIDALYQHYGYQFFSRKKYAQARKNYLKAIELNSNIPAIYGHLGFIYLNSKNYKKAESAYRMVLKLNPNYTSAIAKLGICLAAQKKYSQAERQFKKAIEANPESVENYLNLGHFYYYLRRNYREAKRYYRKALELNPRLNKARNNIRDIDRRFKKWREQESHFTSSRESDPEYDDLKDSDPTQTEAGQNEEAHDPSVSEEVNDPQPLF